MAAIGLQGGDSSADLGPISCREAETTKVVSFCKQCVMKGRAASMYISGTPGVGKTLTIHSAQRVFNAWHREVRLFSSCPFSPSSTSRRPRVLAAAGGWAGRGMTRSAVLAVAATERGAVSFREHQRHAAA